MLAQTTDSGANNNTMAKEMSRIFRDGDDPVHWDSKSNHVRCYAHKLALVVKAGLKSINIDPGHTKPTTKPGREIPTPLLDLDHSSNFPDEDQEGEPTDLLEDGEDIGRDRDGDTDSESEDETDSRCRGTIETRQWKPDLVVQGVNKVSL